MPTRQVIVLRQGAQVAASQTDLRVGASRMPRGGRVSDVRIWCRALTGTVTVDIWKNGATILTADVTPIALTHVQGALDLSKTGLTAGDDLQLIITTGAASTVDDVNATISLG